MEVHIIEDRGGTIWYKIGDKVDTSDKDIVKEKTVDMDRDGLCELAALLHPYKYELLFNLLHNDNA